MNNWVRVRGAMVDDIEKWCRQNNITAEKHNAVINPITFSAEHDWYIDDEKELLIFTLKWSNTR